MRIVNLDANPRFLSFASPTFGGKSVRSGEMSAEVPLDRIHLDVFKKELDQGKISIRLSADDKAYLIRLLDMDKKDYTVKQLPAPAPKPVKKVKKKEATPNNPKIVGGVDAGPVKSLDRGMSRAPVTDNPVTPENIKKGVISLADLQKQNRAPKPLPEPNAKATLQEIGQFMHSKV